MSTIVMINPGAGPIPAGSVTNARKNIHAFVKDLELDDPPVEIDEGKNLKPDDDGRYVFELVRGQRSTTVSMPAYPLDKVRILHNDGQNPWSFPRLYVDGSSWLWCFAVDNARDDLFDPYKVVEIARDRSEKENERIIARTGGRCPTCNSVLENQGVPHPSARYQYASYKVVCLGCTPQYTITRRDHAYSTSVRLDWKDRDHWAITYQIMPNQVLGADHYIDPDTGEAHKEAFCPQGVYSGWPGQCIRRYQHEGAHAYRYKELSKIFIRAKDAIPVKHPSSCACDGCRWYRSI